MIEGEFESLKAIHGIMPMFVTEPYCWGAYESDPDSYFIMTQFREIIGQPPEPVAFTKGLARMHGLSKSPTGKFGFHVTTCRAIIEHLTDLWEESWETLYSKQLMYLMKLDREKNGEWPEFHRVCALLLEHVLPRLLRPLQSDGRSIKPCLVHGDLWEENSATDPTTGEPFLFDPCSFYAHNEYELGNWRALRHRLSDPAYVNAYKSHFPPSEPGELNPPVSDIHSLTWPLLAEDWDDRNLLYSLRFDLGTAILMPTSPQRRV
jgi:protein-ribulosamine 3-kinase